MTPWLDKNSIWKTKPAYFSWLRGGLRRMWARHPLSIKFKNSQCRPARPSDKLGARVKFAGKCARCEKWHAKSKLEVDHMEPAGSLQDWNDVGPFVQRLLGCSSASLRLVCKPCHKVITHAERFACTEDEAIIQKRVILFSKLAAEDQRWELAHLGLPYGRNASERRTIYFTHIMQNP